VRYDCSSADSTAKGISRPPCPSTRTSPVPSSPSRERVPTAFALTLLQAYKYSQLDSRNPSQTGITFASNGSPPDPTYTLTRSQQTPNTYSISLADAHFPSITYASINASLEFTTPPPSPEGAAPKVLLPAEFTLNLYNPDSSVRVELKHSTLKGNYWEFSLPKRSFLFPTASQLDARYAPPASERMVFRWRKEGGVLSRQQLRCTLVSPGHLPGTSSRERKAGATEPDITLCMYSGVGEKNGRGELVVYESNFRRVDIEDLKGLEMILVLGARVVNDIWFCATAISFNTHVLSKKKSFSPSTVLLPPTPPVSPSNGLLQAGTFPRGHHQQQQFSPTPSPEKQPPYPSPTPLPRRDTEAERRRIQAEQDNIRRMLAREEEREKEREKERVEAETIRLRREYEQEQMQLRRAVQMRFAQNQQQQQQQQPQQQQQKWPPPPPPLRSQPSAALMGRPVMSGAAVPPGSGGKGKGKGKGPRKSFLGLKFGGGEGGGKLVKQESL